MDTNVLIALFGGDEEAVLRAQHALESAAARAALAVSPAVYAELLAGGRPAEDVRKFFSAKGIGIDWDLGEEVWRAAGSRFGSYARDRKRQRGSDGPGPRRILADFLVGAHALHLGGRTLLTADTRIFASYFPEIRIIAVEQ